jgi:glycosyltransferase involved in cell wall biosynthesis
MNKDLKIILLSCFFPDELYEEILDNSKGMPHTANDNFLKALVAGYRQQANLELSIINAPLIGSFPFFYRKIWVNKVGKSSSENYSFISIGYLNLTFIKNIFLYLRFKKLLYNEIQSSPFNDIVIQVYGSHIPMMRAALTSKRMFENIEINLILPDLPEFYAHNSTLLWRIRRYLLPNHYRLIKQFDNYILFTIFMADRLNLNRSEYIVIEGIANVNDFVDVLPYPTEGKKIIFYAGTLAKRYGILDLIEVFNDIKLSNVQLWICGSGDSSALISNLSEGNSNIRYFGNVGKSIVRSMMLSATVLVNPRRNIGLFTKYSFPSKTMEYLSSGTPVLMYKLDGIPSEYDNFIQYIPSGRMRDFKNSILYLLNLDLETKLNLGKAAKDFILSEKNQFVQSEKIVRFLKTASI